MGAKLFCVVCALAVVLSADDVKRDKRTIDVLLRGVADVFGYDVLRRITALPARLAEPPKQTFFPPPLSPLPPGSYSRIILSLGQQGANQLIDAQPNVAFTGAPQMLPPVVMPLSPSGPPPAPALPMAAPASAPPMVASAPLPQMPNSPMAPASKPEMRPGIPPVVLGLEPAPATVPQGAPVLRPGNAETFDGPTRWTLFSGPPRNSESIRRTINFNINWDRNVQPLQQAIVSQAQSSVQPSPAQPQLESIPQQLPPPPPPQLLPLPPTPPQVVLPPPAPPQMIPQQHVILPPPPPPQMVLPPPPQQMLQPTQFVVQPPPPSQMVLPPPLPQQMIPPPSAMMIPLPAETPPAPVTPQPAPSEAPLTETPKTTGEDAADPKLNFSRIFDFDYNFDDDKLHSRKNTDSQENKKKENFEDQRGQFLESIRAFWDASPWKSNSFPSSEKSERANLKDGPVKSKYEEYDLEPNVEELNAAKSENYKLNVEIPLPEYKSYYDRDEDASEEDRPHEKQSKTKSNVRNFDDNNEDESHRGKVKYRKVKKVRTGEKKKDREEIQPEVSGIFPKQLHELYKREKNIPWPVPVKGEADESTMKSYYRKYRRDDDRNGSH